MFELGEKVFYDGNKIYFDTFEEWVHKYVPSFIWNRYQSKEPPINTALIVFLARPHLYDTSHMLYFVYEEKNPEKFYLIGEEGLKKEEERQEMPIISFMKTHSNWEELLAADPYNLSIKKDNINGKNYAIFKYSMVPPMSDFSLKIVQQARGLIIDIDTLIPVCVPFYKFFNYGEPYAAKIDWNSAAVQEKVDGSLIKIWWNDKNGIQISTNGTIDAWNASTPTGSSYGKEVLEVLLWQYPKFFDLKTQNTTMMFEFTSPDTQIVVNYGDKPKLRYLGSRNNITLEEFVDEKLKKLFGNMPKIYAYKNLKECINFLNTVQDLSLEGFVVVDKNYNRIKIKSPLYIEAHRKVTNIVTKKQLMKCYLEGDYEEIINYIPDFKYKMEKQEKIIDNIAHWVALIIAKIKEENPNLTIKDFAIRYKEETFFPLGIKIFKNPNISIEELKNIIKKLPIDKILYYSEHAGHII